MSKVKLISLDSINVRVQRLCNSLLEKNNDVEVLLLERKEINNEFDYVEECVDNIRIKRFFCRGKSNTDNYGRIRKKIIYTLWFLNFIVKINRYLKENDCDYIIAQANIGTFAGLLAKRKNTILIYDMRELYEGRGNKISKILKAFNSFLIRKSDYVIYLNEKQKSLINKKYHYKLIYLPNYVSKNQYKKIEKTKSNYIRVSYIGCPRDEKSLENFVRAGCTFDNFKIYIHGYGTAYDKLKKLEGEYENLKVTGKFDGINDSEKLFQDTDVLFCGYDTNNINWKNAIAVKFYESIITLTPIIVFENSVMGNLVKKYGNGFLINKNNVESFKKTFKTINVDNINRIKKNIKKIQYDFIWEEIIKNIDFISDGSNKENRSKNGH